MSDNQCAKCSDPERSRTIIITVCIVMLLIGIPIIYGGIYYTVADKNSSQWLVYFRLMVDHMQLLSINTGIKTSWPWHLLVIFQFSEGANLNLDYLNLECGFGSS